MNQQEKNIQFVKDMFAAINRGDIPYLLNQLADNVDWQSPVTNTVEEPVSWSKPRKNRSEVSTFYKEFMEKIKVDQLRANNFIAQNDIVVVDANLDGEFNRASILNELPYNDYDPERKVHPLSQLFRYGRPFPGISCGIAQGSVKERWGARQWSSPAPQI